MNDDALSHILKAVGDVTRRHILTLLVQEGASRVTALAAHFDMSLNSVSKHIKEPVREVEAWFAELKSVWELRLTALEDVLVSKEHENE